MRLGLVTLQQMLAALTLAVDKPGADVPIVDVPAIRVAAGIFELNAPDALY